MANSTQIGVGACVVCFAVFISLILFIASWSSLEPLEIGLASNDFAKTVDTEQVFTSGRYLLGIGKSFIKYPKKAIIIDFSPDDDVGGAALQAGTMDGQSVTLEVSLWYTLIEEELGDLYTKFQNSYRSKFVAIAESTLKNTAVLFTTEEYFSRRLEIADAMTGAVNAEFKKNNAKVDLLQLRDIGVPASFENELVRTVIAQQDEKKAAEEKKVQLVTAQTEVIRARAQGEITEILGTANAEAARIREVSLAEGTRLVVSAERDSFRLLREILGFDNAQLYKFLFYTRKIRLATTDKLLVGFGSDSRLNITP